MKKHGNTNKIWDINSKDTCRILLNPDCSNRCLFCDRGPKASTQQLMTMQKNVYAAIPEFHKRKYKCIEICGEDPLEYPGLTTYVRDLKKSGFKWVILSTNGIKLSDLDLARELSENVDQFRIPLYGSTSQVHDKITRAPKSFKQTIQGIQNIRSLNKAKIELTSMLLKQNCLELPHILDLMHKLNCDALYIASVLMPNQSDEHYYVPHKYQGFFLKKLILHAQKNKRLLKLANFPYCVIGFDNNFTEQQPEITIYHALRGFKAKQLCLDSHRKKIEMCNCCAVQDKCCGFLVMDVLKYGTGDLKPIK